MPAVPAFAVIAIARLHDAGALNAQLSPPGDAAAEWELSERARVRSTPAPPLT